MTTTRAIAKQKYYVVMGKVFLIQIHNDTVSYFENFVKQCLVMCKKKVIFSYECSRGVTFFDKFVDLGANYEYTRR